MNRRMMAGLAMSTLLLGALSTACKDDDDDDSAADASADASVGSAADATTTTSSNDGATHESSDADESDGSSDSATSVSTDASCDGDGGCSVTFASGTDWPSYGGDTNGVDGGTVGPADLVCLTSSYPAGCAPSAVVYGATATGWTATSTLAPSAQWIWRGDTAVAQTSDLVFAVFQKTFTLGAAPSGSIQLAADDFAEVRVNGVTVGTVGSISDESAAFTAQTTAATFDLSANLHPGDNTITIVAQNGPASFAGCSGSCTYTQNTAGTLFGGVLTSH